MRIHPIYKVKMMHFGVDFTAPRHTPIYATGDGVVERVTDPDGIRKAVQTGEQHLGMPQGTWDRMLEMTLKKPEASNFWKIKITDIGGQGVEDFKEEFYE